MSTCQLLLEFWFTNRRMEVKGIDRLGIHVRSKSRAKKVWIVNFVMRTVLVVLIQILDLRAACFLVSTISSRCLPLYHLSRRRTQLGLPLDLKLSTFVRRYPALFSEFPVADSGGTLVPWFRLTDEALSLRREELHVLQRNETDVIRRLQKLLMLTRDGTLPLQTIDQLKWDMGLQDDYPHSLIPRYPHLFSLLRLSDDRLALKLLSWDNRLAVSQLQLQLQLHSHGGDQCLAFPIRFTRGFGLKRKCMEWLEEWQRLPYTSPYADASSLDPRTDVSEKRIVGVFHELLHLTIQKKTERKNVSNLRKPLGLPQKFTKVFGRHPGIFYISHKCATQTLILRESYDRQQLLHKHPLVEIRERYATMMRTGSLNKSKNILVGSRGEEEDHQLHNFDLRSNGLESEGETECSSDCKWFS
ncbi:hypothetical protein HHK36_025329 [Tetracentron sinense]|uniref:PORR domain-containing protein n=1 Tax=Tetracentron sinense TaxID=13715 RepID=A0A834YSI5_TETSI|nr:hypothetical protein HHK36_025329 [Tetracentron sinense]